jgi:hypothetical protein
MPPKAASAILKTPKRSPRTITTDYVEALVRYAEVLYKGGLVPKIKDVAARPETVAALIEVGRDVGLPATQAVSWIMLVNGRPSIWGDAGMALILASGLVESRREWYEGERGEDDYTAFFAIKRVGAKDERVSSFSVADARRADLWGKKGPWTTYPERMLMWRAKGFACRDEFPDVLCGLIFTEESLDFPDAGRVTVIPPEGQGSEPPKRLAEATTPFKGAGHATPALAHLKAEGKSVTEEQLDRIGELRERVIASGNCTTDDERRGAWTNTLAPYGVTTACDFSEATAAQFIEDLSRKHDPFTHPPQTQPAG